MAVLPVVGGAVRRSAARRMFPPKTRNLDEVTDVSTAA
jgi:hypothetical protein